MHLPLLLALLATSALAAEVSIDVTNPVECTRKTQAGDSITVNYRGTLPNGEEFDSSYNRKPFQFQLGAGQVIQGYVHISLLLTRLRSATIGPVEISLWVTCNSLNLMLIICRWDQGLLDMCIGEKRKLTIPGSLAYGTSRGIGSCKTDCTLRTSPFAPAQSFLTSRSLRHRTHGY
jgi:hypothetical protein